MSIRSSKKLITKEARILRSMRERSRISMRDAAAISGLNPATINHIENGRQNILRRHLEMLLPAYGKTLELFDLELMKEEIPLCADHSRCMEHIPKLSDDLAGAFSRIFSRLCSLQPRDGA